MALHPAGGLARRSSVGHLQRPKMTPHIVLEPRMSCEEGTLAAEPAGYVKCLSCENKTVYIAAAPT